MGLLKKLLTLSVLGLIVAVTSIKSFSTVTVFNSRSIMEGLFASKHTVFIDTTNARVDIGTNTYGGNTLNVVQFSTGNSVWSTSNQDNVVVYATGTVHAITLEGTPAPGYKTPAGNVDLSTTADISDMNNRFSAVGVSTTAVAMSTTNLSVVKTSTGTCASGQVTIAGSATAWVCGQVATAGINGSTTPASADALYQVQQGTNTLAGGTSISTTKSGSVWTIAYTGSNPVATYPTRQILTSGTGATYTTPANVKWLYIRMCGGGGGGGAQITNAGAVGGASSFYQVVASSGGGGGVATSNTEGLGGSGGTNGTSASIVGIFRVRGAMGQGGNGNGATTASDNAGHGGMGAFGGDAPGNTQPTNSANPIANSCSGGAGGGTFATGIQGAGGGAGEYVEFILTNPSATYLYTIGAGGAGGVAGTIAGFAAGTGVIIVDEHYNY